MCVMLLLALCAFMLFVFILKKIIIHWWSLANWYSCWHGFVKAYGNDTIRDISILQPAGSTKSGFDVLESLRRDQPSKINTWLLIYERYWFLSVDDWTCLVRSSKRCGRCRASNSYSLGGDTILHAPTAFNLVMASPGDCSHLLRATSPPGAISSTFTDEGPCWNPLHISACGTKIWRGYILSSSFKQI